MEEIKVVEVNNEKAVEWYANKEGLSISEVEEYPFFENLQEAFEYVYNDENDSHQQTIDTLKWASNIDIQKVVDAGVNTIAEYLALEWERLTITPYGYLAIEI